MSSVDFQQGFYEKTGRVTVSFREYEEGVMADYMQKNMDLAADYLRVAPNPANTHPDVRTLVANVLANAPKPTLKELFLISIMNGEPFEELAKDYDTKMDAVIDEQIALLQEQGSDITREALVFPSDWDMDKNYIG